MACRMILENGVLKAIHSPQTPVRLPAEMPTNVKFMGNFHAVRQPAVEIVANVPFRVDHADRHKSPVIQQDLSARQQQRLAESTGEIKLPPVQNTARATETAFAAASITFDEPDDDTLEAAPVTAQVAPSGPVAPTPAADVAQMIATQDIRNLGMTLKDFNAYQLKGAQVRKIYERLTETEAADLGINRMTKVILEEAGKSTDRYAEVVRLILDIKRGAV